MKIGICYAYWEHEWELDAIYYTNKVADLGFDVCELGTPDLLLMNDDELAELKKISEERGIEYSTCMGLSLETSTSSPYESVRQKGVAIMKDVFDRMNKVGCKVFAGVPYSYWPVNYFVPFVKEEERAQAVKSMKELADYAAQYDITIALEVLNRFEQYIMNDAAEARKFADDVGKDNVKLHLDTFHMNIEEDSIEDAIRASKGYVGYFHLGEANRKPPYRHAGGRINWEEVAQAVRDIDFKGYLVLEPFVLMGGQVGADVKLYRDLSGGADTAKLDEDIKKSLAFVKEVFHD